MCVSQQVRVSQTGLTTTTTTMYDDNADVADALTAQRWNRTYRQPMKARLPRRLTGSARIDLNRHWSALEQLVTCTPQPQPDDADAEADADVEMANAVNENLANERLEADSAALERRFVTVDVASESSSGRFWKDFPTRSSARLVSPSALIALIKKLAR